ncbi:Inner membrane protein yccS [Serratia entomophila]|jgi:YccS/YhfK family integral membrane protein|uniref:YccS/YhfK family putative transporter n=1 Tax=Serratia entomophila TaxID=42906 RepID=UPI00217A7D94|nr:YccS/YhfK family putative transporter [Serratia entomophila]CAI1105878.1 Inner membrane protein yccS [Serratia entomophila]CAI1861030.1 Inner membrane protein yccS [Serratia entomophila]CAI1902053.1 Inner membrane protein yccS [Serratia entomophila]CAI1956894.1 Inner membrane protein yccS [Serratia entomophila]CAI2098492.1 Inner membrane protein yccS [Serratia entomophila]
MWRRLIYHPEVNYALRQTLVLCLPVLFGLAIGQLQLGLLFSLVPACCNIAGLDTPHKRFFKRLIVGGSLFAFSSLLLQQALLWQVPLPALMLGLALLLGVSGEISPLHARLLPAALIAAIFSLSMAGTLPIWQAPLLYAIGTAWYGLFTWFWFTLWKEQPMRESLNQLYLELADYFEAKYSLLTQHTDPQTALPPLLARQQKVMDLIGLLYQQLNFLPHADNLEQKRLQRAFQVALDLQEHITVSLHQPEEVQKLVEQSQAEAIIRRNAQVIAGRLRVVARDILYHQHSQRFNMAHELAALEKVAAQHADNPVGQFCYYHFSRIARLLRTQHPLYRRDLMASQARLPFWPALTSYLSFKSNALRNAARLGVMLALGSSLGTIFNLPKPYWILLTIMLVSQNGYNATRVRIQHRALGTLAGLVVAAALLQLQLPEAETLGIMLVITLLAYLVSRKNYGLAVIGFTITAVYTLQLLALNGTHFLVPRLVDTLIGCVLVFGGTIWLWPQWQSGLLRKNAHQALENDQHALRLMLEEQEPDPAGLAYARMQVNQAHNALYTSLNQAMQEPGFASDYLADMRLWVTHSQFIVEHLNAMTILAREHYMLTPKLAETYLQTCEIALQSCQQRLEYDGPSGNSGIMQPPDLHPDMPITEMERHLRRILSHLSVMHTISSLAWSQRPHHGIWLKRKLRDR